MMFLNTTDIVGYCFSAQQLRLDMIAENVTNPQTTYYQDRWAYDLAGPDADKGGYLGMPNEDMGKEMADAMASSLQLDNPARLSIHTYKTAVALELPIQMRNKALDAYSEEEHISAAR